MNTKTWRTDAKYDRLCQCEAKYTYDYSTDFHLIEFKCHNNSLGYIADLCKICGVVSVVDRERTVTYEAFSHTSNALSAMCEGPDGTLLVWDEYDQAVLQLQWNDGDKQLYQIGKLKVSTSGVKDMCYNELHNIIVFTSDRLVTAVYLDTGAAAWKLNGTFMSRLNGLCCDDKGHIFVANDGERSVWVVCGATGHILCNEEVEYCQHVCWMKPTNQLIVNTGLDLYRYDIKSC